MAGNHEAKQGSPHISTSSSLSIVLDQCNDVIAIQGSSINSLKSQIKTMKNDQEFLYEELKKERERHVQLKSLLDKEHEKCQLLETEVMVIKKQLGLEKKAFEKAFGLLNKSFSQDTSSEELIKRMTGLEAISEQRKIELEKRDKQIKSLQTRLVAMEMAHKKEKEELQNQLRQKIYSANIRAKKSTIT